MSNYSGSGKWLQMGFPTSGRYSSGQSRFTDCFSSVCRWLLELSSSCIQTTFYQIGFFPVNAMGESLEVHCDSIPIMSSVDCVYLCFYRLFAAPLYVNDYTLLVRDLMHRPLLSSCPLGSSTSHAPMINILFYRCYFFCS